MSGPVCAAPAPSALQAGEIALEGTSESLDVVKNTLVLRATSFATPSSKSKPLPQPKIKPIQIGDATQFVESAGTKNLSLGDLEKGLKIRVVGREAKGKPFVARLVTWTDVAFDPLTPREKASYLPAPQTQNGVTLRIRDAGWMSLAQMWPRTPEKSTRPVFYFVYDTLPRRPAPERPKNQAGFGPSALTASLAEPQTRLLHVSGPASERVSLSSVGPWQRDDGASGARINGFIGVRPEWQYVVAEFESLDLKAPPEASGAFVSTLSFNNVPIVDKTGKSWDIGTAMTTARGTKIVLQSLRFDPPSGRDRGSTSFEFAVTLPPDAADMQVVMGLDGVKNQDGVEWFASSGGASGGKLFLKAAPRAGDRSLSLHLQVKESAPSLQDRRWIRRFRIQIPVAALSQFTAPVAGRVLPISHAQGQAVSVEIEPEFREYGGNWDGIVWIKSRVPLADPTQRWLLREHQSKTRIPGMGGIAWTYDKNYDRLFMRSNGTRAAPDEHSDLIVAPFMERPTKFDLELSLELARRVETWSEVRGIPLPAPGASLDLRDGQFGNAKVRVRRLFWFQNIDTLFGLPPNFRDGFQNSNLAVVVEILPVFAGASIDIPAYRVADDAGRTINARQWVGKGDAGRAQTLDTNLRTLILPVSAQSKSLDLWLDTTEISWSGQTETLVLKDIAGK